jgi:dihydrofolate reductase
MTATSNDVSREALTPLFGEWRILAAFENMPPADIGGRVSFEWLPGERFLIERWEVPVPEAPDGIAIIGADPKSEGNYLQHYFDSRGVARVYKMSFEDGVWKLWRDEPDFSPLDFASATPAPSAMTARPSQAPGRSATTAGPGSTTSTSPTQGHSGRHAMAKLIYSTIASLDGYVADEDGNFDWAEPDEEVHTFGNDLERPIGTYLYGRRLYEVMLAWETLNLADQPLFIRDFAEIWRAAHKIVYSRTLETVSSARTRIERTFDPEAVRQLKATAGRDVTVGGPDLAAQAFKGGLVDECRLFLAPIVVGGGIQSLPDDIRVHLKLLDERRFGNGMVHLRYRTET